LRALIYAVVAVGLTVPEVSSVVITVVGAYLSIHLPVVGDPYDSYAEIVMSYVRG
tara:strand:+ start:519 stop:683 length:165 start_codon:yes stop_codon:yes gene_type:complete